VIIHVRNFTFRGSGVLCPTLYLNITDGDTLVVIILSTVLVKLVSCYSLDSSKQYGDVSEVMTTTLATVAANSTANETRK